MVYTATWKLVQVQVYLLAEHTERALCENAQRRSTPDRLIRYHEQLLILCFPEERVKIMRLSVCQFGRNEDGTAD
ncbi:hypothetical protein KDK_15780 [Dictyobacter kobayashii]|uniref:Uncharacterized protein n=1 Tax=Dictyobacter kobayashii TaxID=2014872 RepID=A0A402AF88_9CHLR|nr:hypothetical protein KDK_15780 [Dictyobacter kobayashii]